MLLVVSLSYSYVIALLISIGLIWQLKKRHETQVRLEVVTFCVRRTYKNYQIY